jgi:hypothetical protein
LTDFFSGTALVLVLQVCGLFCRARSRFTVASAGVNRVRSATEPGVERCVSGVEGNEVRCLLVPFPSNALMEFCCSSCTPCRVRLDRRGLGRSVFLVRGLRSLTLTVDVPTGEPALPFILRLDDSDTLVDRRRAVSRRVCLAVGSNSVLCKSFEDSAAVDDDCGSSSLDFLRDLRRSFNR